MYFTNYAENAIADMMRGEGLSLPASWWLGIVVGIDSNELPEEVAPYSGYQRVESPRALTQWAGTQAAGSVLPSSGTSHATSNNVEFDFGLSAAAFEVVYLGLYDAETGGNCWMYLPVPVPLDVGIGEPVSFDIGTVAATLALASGCSDYLANKLIDLLFRGEAFAWPATTYIGYSTTMPTNATPGTEPSGGTGYARAAIASTLTAWLGTNGTTAPSTGTSGRISNASALTYTAPTGDQGEIEAWQQFDAASAGNLLFYAEMDPGPVSVRASGDAPRFEPLRLGIDIA